MPPVSHAGQEDDNLGQHGDDLDHGGGHAVSLGVPDFLPANVDDLEVDLPDDWRKRIVRRKSGNSQGGVDVYITTPPNARGARKRLRSSVELLKYLCEHPDIPIDPAMVNFERMFKAVESLSCGPAGRLAAGIACLKAQACNGEPVGGQSHTVE
jgi:hypothetical protein